MFNTLRKTAAIAALGTMTIALAPAAFAGTASAPTAELRYGDLDLGTAAGQAELASRIDTAARSVCRAEAVTGSRIADKAGARACIANVHRQIESRLARRGGSETRGR